MRFIVGKDSNLLSGQIQHWIINTILPVSTDDVI